MVDTLPTLHSGGSLRDREKRERERGERERFFFFFRTKKSNTVVLVDGCIVITAKVHIYIDRNREEIET